jgi:thymidylate kinase
MTNTPIFAVVDGINASGKTAVIKSAMRGLMQSNLRVLHHQWRSPARELDGKNRLDWYLNQAADLDAKLHELAKDYDVIICDRHPCITEPIYNHKMRLKSADLWESLHKPDLVLILSCLPAVARHRQNERPNNQPFSHHDLINQIDKYDDITAASAGTMFVGRAVTSTPDGILFAAGDLRFSILQLINAKRIAS